MSDTETQTKTGFAANEPVVVAHLVVWVLANVGAFLVGHTHLFTSQEWSSLTLTLTPFVTAAVLAVVAWITRKFVAPAWKATQNKVAKSGFPLPSDEEFDDFAEALFERVQSKQEAAASNLNAPAYLNQRPANAGTPQALEMSAAVDHGKPADTTDTDAPESV